MSGSLKKLFGGEEKGEKIIAAPANRIATLTSQASDPIFSQEILGKGTAVIPSDGRVVAPADEPVTMVLDTKYAVSMQTGNGVELTIHIGLDMVQPKGQHFGACVTAEGKVKQGDLLLGSDIGKIKEAGHDATTPVTICNTPQFPEMECVDGVGVRAEEVVIIKL